MILECPACQTRYTVPDGAIGPDGRSVRCKSCGHSWHQHGAVAEPVAPEPVVLARPPVPVVAPEPEPETEPEPFEDVAVEEPGSVQSGQRWPLIAALVIGLLVLAAAAAIALIGVDQLRDRLGLAGASSSVSLLLQVPRSPERRQLASGNELFALTGRIVNPTRERQTVPDIQAELQDAQGRVVYSWIITPPARTLAPGATAEFDAAEVDVPKGAQELKLSFVGGRS